MDRKLSLASQAISAIFVKAWWVRFAELRWALISRLWALIYYHGKSKFMIVVKAFSIVSCYLSSTAKKSFPVKFFGLLLTVGLRIRSERISTILEASLTACAIECCHLTKPTKKVCLLYEIKLTLCLQELCLSGELSDKLSAY